MRHQLLLQMVLLEIIAVVLLGLQLPDILGSLSATYTPGQLAGFTAAVAGTAILARLLWMLPGGYVPYVVFGRALRDEPRPPWTWLTVAGWAGMRGTITLAAALSIPVVMADGSPFVGRDMVIFLSAGVILVTLLLQGTTLEALICKLRGRPDDTQVREDRLARLTAIEAGLAHLRATAAATTDATESAALGEIIGEYEHRRADSRRHRLAALHAERTALDTLWRANRITDETHRPLQHLLDYEESLLRGQSSQG